MYKYLLVFMVLLSGCASNKQLKPHCDDAKLDPYACQEIYFGKH